MPIGGYALNIAFTDGHARGVYPWVYLHALATQSAAITPPPAPVLQDASAP
jgi:prepilin-type processing-associated H-X9-DG protein